MDALPHTQLLRAWSESEETPIEKLAPLVYSEPNPLARSHGAVRPNVAGDRTRERGLCKAGRFAAGKLAEPSPLLRGVCADDAADSGGPRLALTAFDSRKGQVVELRFSGGPNVDETAEVLKVSRNGESGLAAGKELAKARTERGDFEWNLSAGV